MIRRIRSLLPEKMRTSIRRRLIEIPYYRRTTQFKELKKTDGKRIILIGTPEYPNLGDHAIAVAEIEFIKALNLNCKLIEITQENLRYDRKEVFRHIKEDDLIIYTGGGFMGSMYLESGGGYLREVLKRFKQNKIIICPSTCYYESSEYGEKCFNDDLEIWRNCSHLNLFLRDENSWNKVSKYRTERFRVHQVPDMAFLLDFKKRTNRNGVLCILRNDKEKAYDIEIGQIEKELVAKGYAFREISTRINRKIRPSERVKKVQDMLSTISEAEIVITDRLHGMIMSIITNTKVIAIDNKSHKLSGSIKVYDNNLSNLICLGGDLTVDKILENLEKNKEYVHTVNQELYSELADCIRRGINSEEIY